MPRAARARRHRVGQDRRAGGAHDARHAACRDLPALVGIGHVASEQCGVRGVAERLAPAPGRIRSGGSFISIRSDVVTTRTVTSPNRISSARSIIGSNCGSDTSWRGSPLAWRRFTLWANSPRSENPAATSARTTASRSTSLATARSVSSVARGTPDRMPTATPPIKAHRAPTLSRARAASRSAPTLSASSMRLPPPAVAMRMRSRRDSCATVWRPSSSMIHRG